MNDGAIDTIYKLENDLRKCRVVLNDFELYINIGNVEGLSDEVYERLLHALKVTEYLE